jgi:Flp pilus assembly protein TadD
VAALGLLAALFALRSRIGRGPLTAVLAWAITLAPTLGFVDVFFFRYSYVSDHFQYHASAAALALVGCGLAWLGLWLDRRWRGASIAVFAAILVALGTVSVRRVAAFHDERTLWTGTLQENPRAWIAWNNLGRVALNEGRTDEAEGLLHRAIGIDGTVREPWNNLGVCMLSRGRPAQAVPAFERALELYPGDTMAKENLGRALLLSGQVPRAVQVLREVMADPRHGPEPEVDLIEALAQSGQELEATQICQQARARYPQDARFDLLLANIAARHGAYADAAAILEERLNREGRRDPMMLDRLAMLYSRQGRREDAMRALEEALALQPEEQVAAALRRHLDWVKNGEARP